MDHGDSQPLLHDEAHRAVIGQTDGSRRLLETGAAETQIQPQNTESEHTDHRLYLLCLHAALCGVSTRDQEAEVNEVLL